MRVERDVLLVIIYIYDLITLCTNNTAGQGHALVVPATTFGFQEQWSSVISFTFDSAATVLATAWSWAGTSLANPLACCSDKICR